MHHVFLSQIFCNLLLCIEALAGYKVVMHSFFSFRIFTGVILFLSLSMLRAGERSEPTWWKGNLHTHSLWSDGDDYPEMIMDWYKSNGYDFAVLSDHNVIQIGERWSNLAANKGGATAYEKYVERFGAEWVDSRIQEGKLQVRLKPLSEYRPLFDEPGKFLIIQSQELTDRYLTAPIHINVTHIREPIQPQGGGSVLEVMQNNINAILAQRESTGQPLMSHINHPNFGWAITAEEFMQLRGEKFFEVYNGHPSVHNEGDKTHASMERFWDIVLTWRLAVLDLPIMYGIATDDAHNYHEQRVGLSNAGRGWVMVRSRNLTPDHLVRAMEVGDFYASSGVSLSSIHHDSNGFKLRIRQEPDVSYTTYFIGTKQDFDTSHEPLRAGDGNPVRVTHQYHESVGQVLAQVDGIAPSYTFKGDEIYVRAKIVSSKPMSNPYKAGETECAWVQPVVVNSGK
jgi:hypothetical protein